VQFLCCVSVSQVKGVRIGSGVTDAVAGGAAAIDARIGTRASKHVAKPSLAV
jgi:hypothetical protein